MTYKDVDPVKQVTILDVQWSNLDEEIVDEVRDLWRERELGNDYSYLPFNVADEEYDQENEEWGVFKTPKLIEYLKSRGIEDILIHFWW